MFAARLTDPAVGYPTMKASTGDSGQRRAARVLSSTLAVLLIGGGAALVAESASAAEVEAVTADEPELGGADEPVDDAFIGDLRSDPNFAGAWIDSDRVIHVAFKTDPGQLLGLPASESVVVEVGRSDSFAELVAEQMRLAESLGADTYVEEVEGVVVVQLLRGDSRTIESSVPTRVEFVDRYGQLAHGDSTCSALDDCDDVRADMAIVVSTNIQTSGCSSGGVYKQGGEAGSTTY